MRFLTYIITGLLAIPGLCIPQEAQQEGVVAMITDSRGDVRRGDEHLAVLSPLMEADKLILHDGAQVTIVSLDEMQAYEIQGSAEIVISAGRPVSSAGVKQSKYPLFPESNAAIRPGVIEQASTRTRGHDNGSALRIIGPTTTMITRRPVFRWTHENVSGPVTLTLYNEAGGTIYHVDTQSNNVELPPDIALVEGASYTWSLEGRDVDGRRLSETGNYIVAEPAQVKWKESLGQCEVSTTKLAACALMLEQEGFREDAARYWDLLADIAPDNELVHAYHTRPN